MPAVTVRIPAVVSISARVPPRSSMISRATQRVPLPQAPDSDPSALYTRMNTSARSEGSRLSS